ncbi:MAG: NUDIX domain-containing protein [Anaerolineae bacterium]
MGVSRVAKFCPQCGFPLVQEFRFGMKRPVCPQCGHTVFFDPKLAVATLILKDDSVLLVKRACDPMKGYWALPAGFVEWNEDPTDAACRECMEETGLVVQIDRLLDIFHTPDDGGLADLVIAYQASIKAGTLRAADDAEDVRWFDRESLPPTAFLPSQRLLARWLDGEL